MTERLTIEGRNVWLAPGSSDGPLVIVLHGGFGNPRQAARDYALHGGPETVAYLGAAPGSGRRWNLGEAENGVLAPGRAARIGIDDVGWVERTTRALAERSGAPGRLAVVGHSGGAAMAHRIAVERPALFDDVATVAGGLIAIPDRPYAGHARFLHLYGAADRLWPATGGLRPGLLQARRLRVPSVQRIRGYFGDRFEMREYKGGHEWPEIATKWILEWLRAAPGA